jgi:tripartite-type tricarboxylate transporter receptor subunit TctC
MHYRATIAAVAFAAFAAAAPSAALAQAGFPDRPLRLIVTFPPGGSTDVVARLMAAKMSDGLGRPVVVENKPGAAGAVGTAEAARAPADGYTLLFHIVTTAVINPLTQKEINFDPVKDFQPVAMIAKIPNVMIVNKDIPAKDLREFIAWVKANPGKLAYGSSGTGGVMHISGEVLKKMAGLDMLHVPYKGSAPAIQDMIGGRVVMLFDNITGAIGPIRSGQVRALGVTTDQRVAVLPDVPTIAESGLPEFKNSSWFSIFTRGGVPQPVVARLEQETLKAVQQPDTLAKLNELGAIPAPMNSAELDRFWKAEFDYWRAALKTANIKLD